MASEIKNPSQSPKKKRATELVNHWLKGENQYQFDKNFLTHRGHPQQSRDYILKTEIPNKWHRFQLFRSENLSGPTDITLRRHIGQNILKACAAARAAYVWDKFDQDAEHDLMYAQAKSWVLLEGYLSEVKKGKRLLPDYASLDRDVHEAVEVYSGKPGSYMQPFATYVGMVGLSVTALIEVADSASNRQLTLPKPGVPSGSIEPWRPDSL